MSHFGFKNLHPPFAKLKRLGRRKPSRAARDLSVAPHLLLLVALSWLGPAGASCQLIDGWMLTNEIVQVQARLRWERRGLPGRQLDQLAYTLGRSNYLARAIGMALRRNDLTNAAALFNLFPGRVDDLGWGQPLLHQMVQYGTEAQLAFLLERKANPDQPSPQGDLPLCAALRFQRWAAALELIEAGASVNRTNRQGESPLSLLLNNWWGGGPGTNPKTELLRKLLDHGGDAFAARGLVPESLLEQFLVRQDPAVGDLLLTNRPDPGRRTPRGDTALHLAALWFRTNAFEFLLASGFSANQTNEDGLTPAQLVAGWIRPPSMVQQQAFRGPQFYSGPFGRFGEPGLTEVVALLSQRGATLDVFCVAGLGRTNELAALLEADQELAKARDGYGRTPLHYAVGALQTGATRLLIRSGAEVRAATTKIVPGRRLDFPLPAGSSPLHLAALRGSSELVQLLLRAGADPAASDSNGDIPLHLGARHAQTNCVAWLIAARSPLDATNQSSQTPLRVATEGGAASNVQLLLESGARPNAGLGSNTLLHLAAEQGSEPVLKVLLGHRLAVEARNGHGQTPLQRAIVAHRWGVFEALRSKGADVNVRDSAGDTALHLIAAQQDDNAGHYAAQPLLVRWKRDWLSQPGVRRQALGKLIQWKIISAPSAPVWTNSSITGWLLEHGAKPGLTNRPGDTPLHVLCRQSWLPYVQPPPTNRAALLLDAGARLEARDARGLTCLHLAATNASLSLLSFLAKRTANPDALRDTNGLTPLHYTVSAREDAPARAAALLGGGLKPNTTDHQGRTVLHEVGALRGYTAWRRVDFIATLLTNGIDPNLRDQQGFTALHLVMAEFGHDPDHSAARDTISLLLRNGAKPNLRDKQGRTPLHLLAASSEMRIHAGGQLDEPLLTGGWNFAARDNTGQTPIHLLAANLETSWMACQTFLRLVLTNKSLVNLTNGAGDTPLHVALRSGRPYTVELLMKAGADPARRNLRGESAFRLAAMRQPFGSFNEAVKPVGASETFFNCISHRDLASFEKWLKADPTLCSVTNAQGQTPLLAATSFRLEQFVSRLLALGAPMDLVSAIRLGRLEEFRSLLANVHERPTPGGWLFEAVRWKQSQMLQDLVQAGGEVSAVDIDGHSLLYRAAAAKENQIADWLRAQGCEETLFDAIARGDQARVRVLLEADPIRIQAANPRGETPLLAAAVANDVGLVRLLLARGATATNHTGNGWTALHLAAARGSLDIGKRLLAAGADPNALASGGMGPLHIAAAWGHTDFAALLLDGGADVNLAPPAGGGYSLGNTPLHWAAHRAHPETVRLLLARGADLKAVNQFRMTPAGLVRSRISPGFPFPFGVRPTYSTFASEAERKAMLDLLDEPEQKAERAERPGSSLRGSVPGVKKPGY